MRSLRARRAKPNAPSRELEVAPDAVRVWNTLYTLGIGPIGAVDSRGVVYPDSRPVSVEVWFGVGDRWLRGAASDGVRQRRLGGLPIVETRQRIADRDVIQTVWADEPGDRRGRINVALSNDSDDAVVAAIVVRPFERLRNGSIRSIRCAESLIVVDGRPLVDIGRIPGDCATVICEGRDPQQMVDRLTLPTGELVDSWECEDPKGSASLAALIPLTPGVDRTIQIIHGDEPASVAPAPIEMVERGWKAHLDGAAEIDLPGWPAHIFPSLVSSLLGAVDDVGRPYGDGAYTQIDDAVLAAALGSIGMGGRASVITARLLAAVVAGDVGEQYWPEVASSVAAVSGTPEGDAVLKHEREAAAVVIGHTLTGARTEGILAALVCAAEISNGSAAAIDAAALDGAPATGPEARALLDHGWGLGDGVDEAAVDALGSVDVKDAETVTRAMVASVEVGEAFDALVPLRSAAGSSWRWSRGDCGDSPHVRARLLLGLVSWCRRVHGPLGARKVDLFPAMREQWYGQSAGFSGLVVDGVRLSCALRWHGARPALLWEFESATPPNLEVTCLSLDPSFRSTERSGEVLLNAPSLDAERSS